MQRNENRNTTATADLEQNHADAPDAAQKIAGHDSPCSIHIHSVRSRLADPDNVSGKAAIDGIVHAVILPDDTAKQVTEVTYSQQKAAGGPEKTIITLITEEKK